MVVTIISNIIIITIIINIIITIINIAIIPIIIIKIIDINIVNAGKAELGTTLPSVLGHSSTLFGQIGFPGQGSLYGFGFFLCSFV